LPVAVLGRQTERDLVKKLRVLNKVERHEKSGEQAQSNVFVFCDKSTGAAQFRAGATADLDFAVERIAGLLAMKCLASGSEPTDFDVLAPAHPILVNRLTQRAQELLEEGRAVACPSSLSARQKEILQAVLCNQANKEIASKLNITVRTVKFHISTLLSKFGVENRMELARRAANLVRPANHTEFEGMNERQAIVNERRKIRSFSLSSLSGNSCKSQSFRLAGKTLLA
jgi:DNA-binding NarL/FixJ family response regulator